MGHKIRYEEFSELYRTASTPQEERRYLFSLAMFRSPALIARTFTKTINGEIRTQDAPFIVSATMTNVYARELAWEFVKTNWEQMDRLFPKQGLRRMCGGIVGLATPELEQDAREFFTSRKIDLGGKTLDQYLEQLRIAVSFREREAHEFEWVEYDLDGGTFALTNVKEGGVPSAEAGGSIAFEVLNVDQTVEHLRAKGVRIKLEPLSTPVCRLAVILDSEGNAVTLHQVTKSW